MQEYYMNKKTHEVHKAGCGHSPKKKNQFPLGNHPSCGPAKKVAQVRHKDADGCGFCCPACNKD